MPNVHARSGVGVLVLLLAARMTGLALLQPKGPVNDGAGLLSEAQEAELAQLSRDLEAARLPRN